MTSAANFSDFVTAFFRGFQPKISFVTKAKHKHNSPNFFGL